MPETDGQTCFKVPKAAAAAAHPTSSPTGLSFLGDYGTLSPLKVQFTPLSPGAFHTQQPLQKSRVPLPDNSQQPSRTNASRARAGAAVPGDTSFQQCYWPGEAARSNHSSFSSRILGANQGEMVSTCDKERE